MRRARPLCDAVCAACVPPLRPCSLSLVNRRFVEDTAGLKLTSLEDLLETSRRTGEPIRRKHVLAEVNLILEAELGDVVKVNIPSHSPKDIIGSEATTAILRSIFQRCDSPETAVSAVLVSGPNGGRKTFQMEAFAAGQDGSSLSLQGCVACGLARRTSSLSVCAGTLPRTAKS